MDSLDPKAGLLIRDTLDGYSPDDSRLAGEDVATAEASAVTDASPRRRAVKAAQEEAVTKSDPYIWGIYIFILLFSIIEHYSAASSIVSSENVYSPLISHGKFLLIGLGIVFLFQRTKYVYFRKWSNIATVVSLVLLIYSTFRGVAVNGAQRALEFGGFSIQPAEIVKLTIVLFLANILATNQEERGVTNKGVFWAAFVVILFAGITWKNGLTNTVLLMGVSISMFLIGGMQWRKIFIVLGIYGICAGALVLLKYDDDGAKDFNAVQTEQVAPAPADEIPGGDRAETHKGRLARYLEGVHPDDKIDDLNRQVIFANFAMARGGAIGHGPGNSRESARLPLAFSDYIYSIIVEDMGLAGGVVLLCLFLCLLGRAGNIASRCTRAFPALLIMGCAVLIVLQTLTHMAIVVGIVPVSGQPLPFISKGGTSVLVMSAAIGMMLSVSRYGVTKGNKKKIKAEAAELPEELMAANPTAI